MAATKTIPKYAQLYDRFSRDIEAGVLRPGDRLPSFSELYTEFRASTNTVERTLTALEKKGLVRREHGRGVFVREIEPRPRTGVIGIVGFGLAEGRHLPYWGHLFQGVRRAVSRAGGRVLWLDHPEPEDFEGVDGVLVSDDPAAELTNVLPQQVPFVWLMGDGGTFSSVASDDAHGARIATEYLLNRGHQRIAYMPYFETDFTRPRLRGYNDALLHANISLHEKWVRGVTLEKTPQDMSAVSSFEDAGELAMNAWLNDGWSTLACTAILCHNDHVAIGVLRALKAAGIGVPDEVSVVGFDGTELCDYTTPRLTSVQIPLERIGERGVDLLISQIESQNFNPESVLLPAQIRVGESVKSVL